MGDFGPADPAVGVPVAAAPVVVAAPGRTPAVPAPRRPEPKPEPDASTLDLSVDPRGGRVALTLVLLAVASLTALTALIAYVDPSPPSLGATLAGAAATVVLWLVRAGGPVARVTLTGSRLEVVRGESRHVFDLASPSCAVDVIGLPGDRGWRVLFRRRGIGPLVVDATMVDPSTFMRMLHRHRPEVTYRPRPPRAW